MQNINHNNLTNQTHECFDTFAATIMNVEMLNLAKPDARIEMSNHGLSRQILTDWARKGLISDPGRLSALDIAMATILTVLRKRGFSMNALRQVKAALESPMYLDISVLAFAVLFVRNRAGYEYQATANNMHDMPYLVIDGDNRLCLALAHDLPSIIAQTEHLTFSHIALNLGRILNECEFVYKIDTSDISEFGDLPPKIIQKLNSPVVEKIKIDVAKNCIYTESSEGDNPNFGERVEKFQNGRKVKTIIKATEKLND